MLDPGIAGLLKEYLEVAGKGKKYLFPGRGGTGYITKRTVSKVYETACEKAGIKRKGGIHTLRHTFATHLMDQGTDINFTTLYMPQLDK